MAIPVTPQRANLATPRVNTPKEKLNASSRPKDMGSSNCSNPAVLRSSTPSADGQTPSTQTSSTITGRSQSEARTFGLTRTGSVMKSQSSSIPTPRSKVATKPHDTSMPPPTLIGRTQSLRQPLPTKNSGESKSALRVPNDLTSSRDLPSANPKPISRSQSIATTNGLRRTASTRIPNSTTQGLSTGTESSKISRPLHSRAQSVSTTPSVRENVPGPSPVTNGHARSKSTTTGSSASRLPNVSGQAIKPPADANTAVKGPRDVSGLSYGAPKARPVFNTLQQHFSPAKSTSKPPLPPSRLGPSSEELLSSAGVTLETSKLQAELLYLSLLHQEAASTLRAFELSGHTALEKTFNEVQIETMRLHKAEQSYREEVNLTALAAWAGFVDGSASHVLADNIRRLSSCVNELASLSETEARYSNVVQDFTKWLGDAIATIEGDGPGRAQVFVNALSTEWHESHTSLLQRVRLLESEVEGLPRLSQDHENEFRDSAVVKILHLLSAMPAGMETELETMLGLERQVLARDTKRVEEAIGGIDLKSLNMKVAPTTAWHT